MKKLFKTLWCKLTACFARSVSQLAKDSRRCRIVDSHREADRFRRQGDRDQWQRLRETKAG